MSRARQTELFPDLPSAHRCAVKLKPLAQPIWTKHKARLIARYLHYFVLITKHGVYIDGFAGPQREREEGAEDIWSARLVLNNEPRWLRKFFLYDIDIEQAAALDNLVEETKGADDKARAAGVRFPRRKFSSRRGDFNELVDELLRSGDVRPKEATFALLDQRSLECDWSTVAKLAQHSQAPHNKIEIFYFLATGWLARTISGHKESSPIDRWWGGRDWEHLRSRTGRCWADAMTARFRDELGYQYAMAWPIREREGGLGRTMYYMIHATDHADAPKLMRRAYQHVLAPVEQHEQLRLELGTVGGESNE